jgi:hypothetical protein
MSPGAADGVKMTENVTLVVRGPDGEVKQEKKAKNLVTTKGLEGIMDRLLASPTVGVPTHMAIGKKASPTAPAAGDTALQEELDRNALAEKTRSGKVVTYKATWAAGDGTGSITEAGIFNEAAGGTMYNRVTFGTVTKEAADTLEIVWTTTAS